MSKKVLLIGNEDYKLLKPLCACINDVNALESVFITIGFEVKKFINLDYENMSRVFDDLSKWVENGDEFIFYFSGHGYSYDQNNYITCIDSLEFKDIKSEKALIENYQSAAKAIGMDYIIKTIKHNEEGTNILLLDSCRAIMENKDFADSILKRQKNGLVEVPNIGKNFFVSYAAALGQCADEIIGDTNSVYVKTLLKYILIKGLSLDELFNCVIKDIYFNNNQIPWVCNSLTKPYVLIDRNISNSEIEKFNLNVIIELFKTLKSELDQYPDVIDQEELKKILNNMKDYMVYFPEQLVNLFIDKIIIAHEEKIGFMYFLLETDDIGRVDVFEHTIFIEDRLGKNHRFDNEDLYQFDDCVEFLKNYQISSGEDIIIQFEYKNKIINMFPANICRNKYFQIGLNSISQVIGKYIRENRRIDEIRKKIDIALKEKINILVIGSPGANKEDFVSTISNYFRESEKIFKIDSDTKVILSRGIVNKQSISLDEMNKYDEYEFEKCILKLSKEKIDKVILPNKAYCNISDEKFTYLIDKISAQYIFIEETSIESLKSSLESKNMIEDEYIYFEFPSLKYVELVIVLNTDKQGTYMDSIYTNKEGIINKIFCSK